MKSAVMILCGAMLGGCAHNNVAKAPASVGSPQITLTMRPQSGGDPHDPSSVLPVLIHLDIWQFDVPFGAISANELFWKRVDEQSIGAGPLTTQILNNNGLRGGIASKADWPYFRNIIEQLPNRTRKATITKARVEGMELDLDKPAADEDLFFFDAQNRTCGRSYLDSTNTLTLSFEQSARDRNKVRMTICPVVTTERHRLKFTDLNHEYESPFEEIDRLYDLNLITDLPGDDFLIVSPSSDAARTTSIGGLFLVNNDKTEKWEEVLVIVPTFLRLDGKPITLMDDSLKR